MRRVVEILVAGALAGAMSAGAAVAQIDPTQMDDLDLLIYDYQAVRAMAPQGPLFQQGLRAGYLGYADVEYGDHDYVDFVHFARKAVASAKGQRVLPDAVASRGISGEHLGDLTDGRARLMDALNATARRTAPTHAADAQTAFDCWLERAEENTRPEAIAECRNRFMAAMAAVEEALVAVEIPEEFIVFFAFDRADITPVARAVLEEVAEAHRARRPVRLVLSGHADRAGPAEYNVGLSERRARAVAGVLVDLGVDRGELDVQWFGETRNRVPTPDGVPHPENRRVEITFE